MIVEKNVKEKLGITHWIEGVDFISRIISEKNLYEFLPGDEQKISKHHELLSELITWCKNNPAEYAKVCNSLSSCSDISAYIVSLSDYVLQPAELFELKETIQHALSVKEAMSGMPEDFRFILHGKKILKLLGGNAHGFHVASEFSDVLMELRKKIDDTLSEKRSYIKQLENRVLRETGISFESRSEIVISKSQTNHVEKLCTCSAVSLKRESETMIIFEILHDAQRAEYDAQLSSLYSLERQEESKVLVKISRMLSEYSDELNSMYCALQKLCVYLVYGRSAIKYNSIMPLAADCISVRRGSYLPLAMLTDSYIPLDFTIDSRIGVIMGSNMGGKTVALKTLGFLQFLFQKGFFIPAESFSAPLYNTIHFSGGDDSAIERGLSSFGAEIRYLAHAFKDLENNLYLIDELARTTNITEQTAINRAVISVLEKTSSQAIIVSHLDIFDSMKNISLFCVKGFDSERFIAYNTGDGLKQIQQCMDYRVVKWQERPASHDAIAIAEIMGLRKEITDQAKEYIKGGGL